MGVTLVLFSISASATILCILAFISSIICELRPEQRIIGEEFASEGEFPHQVAMLIAIGDGEQLCGGNILAPDYILIAAHCVTSHSPSSIEIVAGKHDITDLSNDPGILGKRVIIHPCYNQSSNASMGSIYLNDIAIIKLDGRLTMGPLIKEIKIDDKDLAQDGKKVQAIGWGRTSNADPSATSDILKKANLKVNATGFLKVHPFYASLHPEGQIIAFNPVEFACRGDSGGPLLCDDESGRNTNVVCGINSLSSTTNASIGDCYGPSIFTRVFRYRKWIKNVLNGDYDSDEGCIGERYLPLLPSLLTPKPITLTTTSAITTERESEYEETSGSRGFPSQFANHFISEICLTLIFLFFWGNQFV